MVLETATYLQLTAGWKLACHPKRFRLVWHFMVVLQVSRHIAFCLTPSFLNVRFIGATGDMSNTNQYQAQVAGQPPHGDSYDAVWKDPYCSKDPGGLSGIWRYGNLRSQGVLTSPTEAVSPWIRHWDNVTQTPWLFNTKTKDFVSYDDPKSIAIKVDYALCKGLGGVMVWSVDEDSDNNELLNEAYKIRTGTVTGCHSILLSTSP